MVLPSQRGILFCVLIAGAFCFALWIFDRATREPLHKGKKLSHWVEDLNHRTSRFKREEAEKAILAIGTNALPMLLKKIQSRDSEFRTNLLYQITKYPGVRSCLNVEWMLAQWKHQYALSVFSVLHTNASPAVPKLTEFLNQGMAQCALALACIGNPAKDSLIHGLNHTNSRVRRASVSALGEVFPTDRRILETLLDAAFDHDREIRVSAIRILGELKEEPNRVVPVLVTLLNDQEVAKSAEFALQQFGEEALVGHRLLRMRKEAGREMQLLFDQAFQELNLKTIVQPEAPSGTSGANVPKNKFW